MPLLVCDIDLSEKEQSGNHYKSNAVMQKSGNDRQVKILGPWSRKVGFNTVSEAPTTPKNHVK